jgi:predicted DNA-binding transcriptional regulator AlpA
MPPVPPEQLSPFPESRSVPHRDLGSRQSKHGIVGGPRGPPPDGVPQRRVLRTPDAAKYIGLTASTLEKKRLTGDGPRFVRIGTRAVGYTVDDLDAYIEAGLRRSTSDPGQPAPLARLESAQ